MKCKSCNQQGKIYQNDKCKSCLTIELKKFQPIINTTRDLKHTQEIENVFLQKSHVQEMDKSGLIQFFHKNNIKSRWKYKNAFNLAKDRFNNE